MKRDTATFIGLAFEPTLLADDRRDFAHEQDIEPPKGLESFPDPTDETLFNIWRPRR